MMASLATCAVTVVLLAFFTAPGHAFQTVSTQRARLASAGGRAPAAVPVPPPGGGGAAAGATTGTAATPAGTATKPPASTNAPVAAAPAGGPAAAPAAAPVGGVASISYRQEMTNHYDMFYTGSITFGGQTIDAILDTGSFDLVVMSDRCKTCLAGTNMYSASASPSYDEGDLIMIESYGSGDLLCQSGSDTLTIGQLPTVDGQFFWEAVYSDLDMTGELGFDVILGLGPPNGEADEIDIMATYADEWAADFEKLGLTVPANYSSARFKEEYPKVLTVLENLDTRIFSICLKRDSGAAGYLIWNDDVYNAQSASFQEVTVAGEHTWTVSMATAALKSSEGVGMSSSEIVGCTDGCGALVDSGTSLLMVPSDVYTNVYNYLANIGASCDNLAALPDLALQIDGQEFKLPPSSYIGYIDTSAYGLSARRRTEHLFPWKASFGEEKGQEQVCTLLLGEFDSSSQFGPLWILGTSFFREFYTTFELGSDMNEANGRKLHLAVASDDCEPDNQQQLQRRQRRNTPVTLDPSKVHVSRRVREMQGKKDMVL